MLVGADALHMDFVNGQVLDFCAKDREYVHDGATGQADQQHFHRDKTAALAAANFLRVESHVIAGGGLRVFFFSSRRRHTRWTGDWSSDVCSSDLAQFAALLSAAPKSKTAARVLDETAGYLGAGIANLINLFNPERIVIGGWAGLALGEDRKSVV